MNLLVRSIPNPPKIDNKSNKKSINFLISCLIDFGIDFGSQNRPKIDKKSTTNLSKNQSKNQLDFESIFYWFGVDFWSILGGARGSNELGFGVQVASWSQVGPKILSNSPQEPPRHPPNRFLIDFLSIWADLWSMFGRCLVDLGLIFCWFLVDWSINDRLMHYWIDWLIDWLNEWMNECNNPSTEQSQARWRGWP